MTVATALRDAVGTFTAAGIESAAHDARVLMAAALSGQRAGTVTPMDVILSGAEPVPDTFAELVERRAAREPLQWILGHAPVVGVDLPVQPGVFIPRPETDLLIEWAAGQARQQVAVHGDVHAVSDRVAGGPGGPGGDDLRRRLSEPTLTVVDLCSGPGTITLGLAHLLSAAGIPDLVDVRMVGIEITGHGVDLARDNERRWKDSGHVDPRIRCDFHRGDAAARDTVIALGLVAAGDIVLANPPYVPASAEVSPEVARDPRDAVFSGEDGLELMRPLAGVIDLVAAPSAVVAVEHDDSTGETVRELLAGAGVTDLEQHRDFADRDRYVTGRIRRDPGHRPVHG